MDTNTLILLVVVLFVVVVLAAIFIFPRVKANIKGPAGLGLDLDASNDKQPTQPGIQLKDVTAKKGNVGVTNEMGSGIAAGDLKAGQDVTVTNKQPQGNAHPKAKR